MIGLIQKMDNYESLDLENNASFSSLNFLHKINTRNVSY